MSPPPGMENVLIVLDPSLHDWIKLSGDPARAKPVHELTGDELIALRALLAEEYARRTGVIA